LEHGIGRKVEGHIMHAVASPTISNRAIRNIGVANEEDATLIEGIRLGDQEALAGVYRLHGQSVLAAALSVTHRKGLAEDVTQEIFVRLWTRADRFDPTRGSLRAFLKIDARGRAIDALRSERSRRNREDREALMQSSGDVVGIEEGAMKKDTSRRIRRLIARLPSEQRAPIALAYFDGHSYREVARILDQPEGTVKSRIRAGLANLQGLLVAAGIEGA
jgi:RNA polymerase sigma-70 factor (ECF subfamily)